MMTILTFSPIPLLSSPFLVLVAGPCSGAPKPSFTVLWFVTPWIPFPAFNIDKYRGGWRLAEGPKPYLAGHYGTSRLIL